MFSRMFREFLQGTGSSEDVSEVSRMFREFGSFWNGAGISGAVWHVPAVSGKFHEFLACFGVLFR